LVKEYQLSGQADPPAANAKSSFFSGRQIDWIGIDRLVEDVSNPFRQLVDVEWLLDEAR